MQERRLRTVLVGAGRIGAAYAFDPITARHFRYASHAQVLAEHPALEWGGCVDSDPDALAMVGRLWGVPRLARSLAELSGSYQPELVILATPPAGRHAQIAEAGDSLRGILVEKPLGTTAAERDVFLEACAARSIPVQVNLWRRFDRIFADLAAGGLSRLIGLPQAVFGVYGNGLVNNGTHLVDFLRMLFGEVARVRAYGPVRTGVLPILGDVNAAAVLEFGGGLTAMVQPLDFAAYREVGTDVWGTEGRLSILNEGLVIRHSPASSHRALSGEREIAADRTVGLETSIGDALYRVYDNLVAAVQGMAPPCCSGEDAARSERVVDAILRSAAAGGRMEEP